MLDPSRYSPSSSCQLYRSELSLSVEHSIDLPRGQGIESVTSSDELAAVYAIVSDESFSDLQTNVSRTLRGYSFNASTFSENQMTIPVQELGLNASEKVEIRLLVVGSQLIVYDGVKMVAVDPSNFYNHWDVEITG